MSYFVIKIYSFLCDYPDCQETVEVAPDGPVRPMLRQAHQMIRKNGWTVTTAGHDEVTYCAKHKPAQARP